MRLKAQSKNEKENFLPEVLFLMFHLLALINKAFVHILKFRSSLFKGLHEPPVPAVALRRARNLFDGVFFLIAFSFAPASSKEKAGINTYAEHVCWRRRDRGWSLYLLFWLLTELKLLFFCSK